MPETESVIPDLNGTPCSVTNCLDVADALGHVDVRCDPDNGVPEQLADQRLDLPLCGQHSHLFRGRPTFLAFDSGA